MDPGGFPTSLPEFQKVFPNDAACAKYLEALRWPKGFACPRCGWTGEPYRFATRSSVVLRCRQCKVNTSLTAGTTMHSSHTIINLVLGRLLSVNPNAWPVGSSISTPIGAFPL